MLQTSDNNDVAMPRPHANIMFFVSTHSPQKLIWVTCVDLAIHDVSKNDPEWERDLAYQHLRHLWLPTKETRESILNILGFSYRNWLDIILVWYEKNNLRSIDLYYTVYLIIE